MLSDITLFDNHFPNLHVNGYFPIFIAEELIDVDQELMTSDTMTDEEILAHVRPDPRQDNDSDIDDDDVMPAPAPSYNQALDALKTVKRYVQSKPNAETELALIFNLEEKVDVLRQHNLTQRTITDFV